VDADQDVSVVIETTIYDGTHYLAASYPGETTPATTVYVPYAVLRWPTGRSDWRQTTDLIVQNTGTGTASVTVTFYDSWAPDSGSYQVPGSYSIPPNGQITVPGTSMPLWDFNNDASLASALIVSDQPIAVVATTKTGISDSGGTITTPYLLGSYRAATTAANTVYLPTVGKTYYTYDSSPQVQNASNGTTTIQVKFYRNGESQPTLTSSYTLGAYKAQNLWHPPGLPDQFLGSAVAEVVSGGPIVAMAQYDRFDTGSNRYGVNQYEGVTAATQSAYMAHIDKTSPWTWTGIQAQNMGGVSSSITLNYYQSSGSGAGSAWKTAPAQSAVNFWSTTTQPPEIPGTLNGSGVASANPVVPMALQVNFDRLGDTGWQNKDGLMGYAAVR
jgi:hypothetical protein